MTLDQDLLQLKSKIEDCLNADIDGFKQDVCFFQLCTSLPYTDVFCSIIKLIIDHYSDMSPLLQEFAKFYIEEHDYKPRDIALNVRTNIIQSLGYELLKQYTKYPGRVYKLGIDSLDCSKDSDYKNIFEYYIYYNISTNTSLVKHILKDSNVHNVGVLTIATLLAKKDTLCFRTPDCKEKSNLLINYLLPTIENVPDIILDVSTDSLSRLVSGLCDIYNL